MNANLTTLGKVVEQVNQMALHHYDDFVPVQEMHFESLEHLTVAGEGLRLRLGAQRSIANRLGIPYQYLARCEPSLQAENLNRRLCYESNEHLFFRFSGEDEVRAIFTPRYTPLDNVEVMQQLEGLGYHPDTPVKCSLDEEFFSLAIPDGTKTFEVSKGDRITPGVSISNSEVGLASLTISAFYLRLICTNGMVAKTEVSSSYRHISTKILGEFPQVLAQVSSDVGRTKDQFRYSLTSPVADPLMTISSFNRQFQLAEKEKDAVTWGYEFEPGSTMYNVMNAYTKGAQYGGLDSVSSHRLEKVGGQILGMVRPQKEMLAA